MSLKWQLKFDFVVHLILLKSSLIHLRVLTFSANALSKILAILLCEIFMCKLFVC